MSNRRKLTDILGGGGGDDFRNRWNQTDAAADFGPLPSGTYVATVVAGELTQSRTNNTPGYKITFQVTEGDYAGRRFWHDLWLTLAALPLTKRDLAKIGITEMEQLEQPIPPGIRCRVKLTLRKDENGTEYNRVQSLECLGVEPVPFAPKDDDDADDRGDAWEPPANTEGPYGAGGDRR